jgi:hypothetical protein
VGRCDQNLDQGAKFCSIFKVLGMRRKWCHCVRLVFLIPAVYLLSQTESVWRRYRDLFAEPNRQKFDADCTCPYSPYRTRADLPHCKALTNSPLTNAYPIVLVICPTHIIFKFECCCIIGKGGGPGLSPDPWFHYNI